MENGLFRWYGIEDDEKSKCDIHDICRIHYQIGSVHDNFDGDTHIMPYTKR